MKKLTTRQIALNGVVAGLYAAITILTASFACADLPEEFAAAHRRQIERAVEGQCGHGLILKPPAELRGLDGVGHGTEHALMAAACHVRGPTHMKPPVNELIDWRNAGGKVHVRFRRMGDEHAVFLHQVHNLGLGFADLVAVDAAPVEQSHGDTI